MEAIRLEVKQVGDVLHVTLHVADGMKGIVLGGVARANAESSPAAAEGRPAPDDLAHARQNMDRLLASKMLESIGAKNIYKFLARWTPDLIVKVVRAAKERDPPPANKAAWCWAVLVRGGNV